VGGDNDIFTCAKGAGIYKAVQVVAANPGTGHWGAKLRTYWLRTGLRTGYVLFFQAPASTCSPMLRGGATEVE
jgi:hypothetical protein